MNSKMQQIKNLTDEELLEICDTFTSATEYLRSIGVEANGRYTSTLNNKRKELNLEWQLSDKRVKEIGCPVCSKQFKPARKEQITCSVGCANTHFRSGENHHNYKSGTASYRTKCFAVRDKSCIVCGEDKIVEVHHYDENHDNNDINNLIPLCPTHHQYYHSEHKHLVDDIITDWRNNNLI